MFRQITMRPSWCSGGGPCRVMERFLVDLSSKYAGRVSVLKMDLHSNFEFADEMNIRMLPTVLFFSGSPTEPVHVFKGLVQPDALVDAVEEKLLAPQQVG